MKKFLCYDTKDVVSGKLNVNSNGVINPNSTVPSTNGTANQYLVIDGDGNVRWQDQPACVGVSRPDTTVSLFVTEPHKIDEKYIPQDKDFIRPLSYYADGWHQFAIYYNDSGDEAICYKCDNINVPGLHDEMFIDADVAQFIIGRILSKLSHSFSASVCVLDPGNNEKSISRHDYIYGTDETEMTQLASMMGYTLTTKPTT